MLHKILFAAIIFVAHHSFCQDGKLELSNLRVNVETKDSMLVFNISMNVANHDQLDSLFFLFGSQKDLGDIKTVKGRSKYFNESNKYAVDFSGAAYPVILGPQLNFSRPFSQNHFINYITVYAKDKAKTYTGKLYFTVP